MNQFLLPDLIAEILDISRAELDRFLKCKEEATKQFQIEEAKQAETRILREVAADNNKRLAEEAAKQAQALILPTVTEDNKRLAEETAKQAEALILPKDNKGLALLSTGAGLVAAGVMSLGMIMGVRSLHSFFRQSTHPAYLLKGYYLVLTYNSHVLKDGPRSSPRGPARRTSSSK